MNFPQLVRFLFFNHTNGNPIQNMLINLLKIPKA